MKKLAAKLITLSAVFVAYMIFAFQLPPKNVQHMVIAKEQAIPATFEVSVKPEISNLNEALFQKVSAATTQPFFRSEDEYKTAALLLLCIGLVGLAGISRKNRN